jgi:hypothetical protein
VYAPGQLGRRSTDECARSVKTLWDTSDRQTDRTPEADTARGVGQSTRRETPSMTSNAHAPEVHSAIGPAISSELGRAMGQMAGALDGLTESIAAMKNSSGEAAMEKLQAISGLELKTNLSISKDEDPDLTRSAREVNALIECPDRLPYTWS